MSPKRALVCATIASASLSALANSGQAQPLNAKIDVECDAFQKNSDGSWTLNRKTVVNEGIYGQILEPRTFRKNDVNVFGFDLTRVLEQDCVMPPKKK